MKGKMAALFALLILVFSGCATRIRIAVERPPVLNTSGIRRVAVMPFEAGAGPYRRDTARYAATVVIEKISALDYFTLVDYSRVEDARRRNQDIESFVDAVFTGRITRIDAQTSSEQRTRKKSNGEVEEYTIYTTKVEIDFNYSFVRARDGTIIGPVSKQGSSSVSSQEGYPPAEMILRQVVDSELRYIGRDIAPYTAIETRVFAADKTKDEFLQADMKAALAQVKAGSYKPALNAYLRIYEQYKSLAAAENASNLYEALGDAPSAAALMRKAFAETGNSRARSVLTRLEGILRDQATLANEYGDDRSQMEKVTAFAAGEIQAVLPGNAVVWIHNSSSGNTMAEAVTDNLIADLIRKGIRVVDRQNAALIEAEQNFQMSGSVSDDDFMSIGNAAGANTIVIAGIAGSGAMRRLQIRVLDIEKRISIMQSDTGARWQL